MSGQNQHIIAIDDEEWQRDQLAKAIIEAGIVPAELAPLVGIVLANVDPTALRDMVHDAQVARNLIEEGKPDEARAMIEQYREMAEANGLGPMFDTIASSIDGVDIGPCTQGVSETDY